MPVTRPELQVATSFGYRHLRAASISQYDNQPEVSPDGRHILTFWMPGSDPAGRRVTIFSAVTGEVVKPGSPLDGNTVVAPPAAWLPDGRDLLLSRRDLYVFSTHRERRHAGGHVQDGRSQSGFSQLTVSPDGQKIVFDWDPLPTASYGLMG